MATELRYGGIRIREADRISKINEGIELYLWTPGGQARVVDLPFSELLHLLRDASRIASAAVDSRLVAITEKAHA